MDRTDSIHDYRVTAGTILQSRSGRNLGPAVIVDKHLAEFVISDDMLRVEIDDATDRLYVLAFLMSPSGQSLLRRDKSGSVIDHISVPHLSALVVPWFDRRVRQRVAAIMGRAVREREAARLALVRAKVDLEADLPRVSRKQPLYSGWSVRSSTLGGRLDAAYHDPLVRDVRSALRRVGGAEVSSRARVLKPQGRYKTMYVGRDFGEPLLSGSQVLQAWPLNLRYLAPAALKDISRYRLEAGWITYQADGRAEESLGKPSVVTRERVGWLASGHVGRVIPNRATESGSLFIALDSWHAQVQIKASASGSVVDSTFEGDMEKVIVPPCSPAIGRLVNRAWKRFALATCIEARAIAEVDRLILAHA